MKKVFGYFSLLVGLMALGFLAVEVLKIYQTKQSAAEYFSEVWSQDMRNLEAESKLPTGWKRIGSIQVNAATELAEDLKKQVQVPVPVIAGEAGDHSLEILLIVLQDPQEMDVVVQYNLLDPQKNLVWELGRTFKLPYPLQQDRNL